MFNSGARCRRSSISTCAICSCNRHHKSLSLVKVARPESVPYASDRKGAQTAHFRTRLGHEIQRASLLQSTRRAAHSLWHPLPSSKVLPHRGTDISIVEPQAAAPAQRQTQHRCFPSQVRRRFTLNQPLAGPCKRDDNWPLRKVDLEMKRQALARATTIAGSIAPSTRRPSRSVLEWLASL
jgi:hypothetical protein